MEVVNGDFLQNIVFTMCQRAMCVDDLNERLRILQDVSAIIEKHIPTILQWCDDDIKQQQELSINEVVKGYAGSFSNLQKAVQENISNHLLSMSVEDILIFKEVGKIAGAKIIDDDDEDDIFNLESKGVEDCRFIMIENGIERCVGYTTLAYVPTLLVCCYAAIQNDIRRTNLMLGVSVDETSTDMERREKKYYSRAIAAGYAAKSGNGYKWLFTQGGKNGKPNGVALSYFLEKIYCPRNTERMPNKRVEKLWNVKRMDSKNQATLKVVKFQKWRQEIDRLFDDD